PARLPYNNSTTRLHFTRRSPAMASISLRTTAISPAFKSDSDRRCLLQFGQRGCLRSLVTVKAMKIAEQSQNQEPLFSSSNAPARLPYNNSTTRLHFTRRSPAMASISLRTTAISPAFKSDSDRRCLLQFGQRGCLRSLVTVKAMKIAEQSQNQEPLFSSSNGPIVPVNLF
nr:pyruvate kinase isozyme G protein [Tanacetum cinerariifolium]